MSRLFPTARTRVLAGLLLAMAVGATSQFAAASTASAAFDVDGNVPELVPTLRAARIARVSWDYNLISASGYADQCTAYAMDRMFAATGLWLGVRGDAHVWAEEARLAGWTVGRRPRSESVLVMPPEPTYRYVVHELDGTDYETPMHPLGHVAWVELVAGDWVLITDQNWRRGLISARWVFVKDSPMQFIYSH